LTSKDAHSGQPKVTEERIFAKKEPGVEGNKSTKREFVFDIPKEYKAPNQGKSKVDLTKLINQ
jgi:hypothetical protein